MNGYKTTSIADSESVKRTLELINENAKKDVYGIAYTKYGALKSDGTIIICDVISATAGGFKRVRFPDGTEKLINPAADGYIPVVVD